MIEYYSKRAEEYELIYQKPERQNDLRKLELYLSQTFTDKNILELACGTGYWTQFISHSAKTILATDYNEAVLKIAKNKTYHNCRVTFQKENAYTLREITKKYSGCFSGFWWSHIPKNKIIEFLTNLHSKLEKGSMIIFCDNLYVEGSSTPLSKKDGDENTYQLRTLKDRSEYEVLKNFPTEEELREYLTPFSNNIKYIKYDYYWLVEYII